MCNRVAGQTRAALLESKPKDTDKDPFEFNCDPINKEGIPRAEDILNILQNILLVR